MAGEKLIQKALGVLAKSAPQKFVTDPAERAANLARFMEPRHPDIPNVMYHGKSGEYVEGRAPNKFFLTPDPTFAEEFAHDAASRSVGEHPNIMPFHVGAKNPFDYDNPAHIDFIKNNARLSSMSPERKNEFFGELSQGDWHAIEHPDVQRLIKPNFDAFFVREMNDDGNYLKNLGVYNPDSQLKSATGNAGTFDPEIPRLNEAHGGEVDAALHAVRHHLAGGGFLSDLFSGPDYLSTGEVASFANMPTQDETNADFFKADRAMRLAREVQAPVTSSVPDRAPLTAPRSGPVEVQELPVNIPFAAPDRGVSMLSSDISPASVTSLPLAYTAAPTPAPASAAIDQATGKMTARIPDEPHGTALTKQQADYVIRTIAAETSGKSPEETQAIASVILNRINSGKYGASPEAVLFAKRQFEPWMNKAGKNYPMKISPTSQRYLDARSALEAAMAGEDITRGATNFWGPKSQYSLGRDTPDWALKMPDYTDIGATRFHRPNKRAHGGLVDDALHVVREHHADGEAVGPTMQQRLRETIASIDPERSREQPVMDPATMGEAWDRARRNYQNFPVQEGEAVARPLELGARDVIGGAIGGEPRAPGADFRRGVADLLVGSTGLPDSGTLGVGALDATRAFGIPLTLADMAHDIGQGDYANAAMNAALPAAFYARGPLGAAGRRAVEIAKDYAKPAAAAAAGVAGATVAPDEAEAAVPLSLAKKLITSRNLPKDEKFMAAVKNMPGASIADEHLVLPVSRNQKPEQAGLPSVRGGVFYLPEGSANQRYYTGSGANPNYGGAQPAGGETAVANPLFVKGATGGKAPEEAYKYLMGKDAFNRMQNDVNLSLGSYFLPDKLKKELVQRFLDEHAPSLSDMSDYIFRNSSKGNQLKYALQEAAAGEAVRNAGHDAVLGYSTSKTKGPIFSELFDVRERAYPKAGEDPELWPQFWLRQSRHLQEGRADGGSVEDRALMLVSQQA
jgi:spore germination cell wall hydrolase CwlJ-like protein